MRCVMNVRPLYSEEIAVARRVFKNTIHYDQVLLSDGLGYDDREFRIWPSITSPNRHASVDLLEPGGFPLGA